MALEHINSWSQRAKCRDSLIADELFFPRVKEGAQNVSAKGKKFCTDCPVLSQCKIYAIAHVVYGVCGGTTKSERDLYPKTLKLAIKTMYIEAHQLEPLTYWNSKDAKPRRKSLRAIPGPIECEDRELDPTLTLIDEASL